MKTQIAVMVLAACAVACGGSKPAEKAAKPAEKPAAPAPVEQAAQAVTDAAGQAATAVTDAAGAATDAAGQVAAAATDAAGQAVATAGAAVDQAALDVKLAAADLADGTADKVVTKCVGCKLGMNGKPEHSHQVGGYTLHLCSPECLAKVSGDAGTAIMAL